MDQQTIAKQWIKDFGDGLYGTQNLWVEFKTQVIDKETPINGPGGDTIDLLLPKTKALLDAPNSRWRGLRSSLNPYFSLSLQDLDDMPMPQAHEKVTLSDSSLSLPLSSGDGGGDILEQKYQPSEEKMTLPGFSVSHHAINDLPMIDLLLKTPAAKSVAVTRTSGRRVVLNDQSSPSLAIPDMLKSYAQSYAERNGQTWLLFKRDWNTLVFALESGKETEDARVARVLLIGLITYIVKGAMNDFTTSPLIYGATDKLSDAVIMSYRN